MNETAHFRQESYELNKSSFSQHWEPNVLKMKSQYLEIERNPFDSGIKWWIDRFINPDIRHIQFPELTALWIASGCDINNVIAFRGQKEKPQM